ncbi:hydroxymethylbilane synthase [Oxyplasma meridianum]|uniref:Hydroxymethylbilane synthase n=1 Tax=Oxyplasma meridianum TaxID=3073602 RepID=A0AAX4NDV7_9ARCH
MNKHDEEDISLGSRSSHLAIAQTKMVRSELLSLGINSKIVKLSSKGDIDRSVPLYRMKGTGVFVEELNNKVLDGTVEAVVHSAKDVPSLIHPDLEISAVLERAPPEDVLISKFPLGELPEGSKIGTSSIRRIRSLVCSNQKINAVDIRGNVDTRISKLKKGEYDGIVLAKAGLERLGIKENSYSLPTDEFVPAPNQGIICIISRRNSEISRIMNKISHEQTMQEMRIERKVVEELDLGCSVPAGILCRKESDRYVLTVRFYSLKDRRSIFLKNEIRGPEDVDAIVDNIKVIFPDDFGYRLGR